MAALSPEVKAFIVQALACFDTPTQIASQVKQEFGLDISIQQVSSYDPTKAIAKNLGQKWIDLFNATRSRFQTELSDIPIANKAYRLRALTSTGTAGGTSTFTVNIAPTGATNKDFTVATTDATKATATASGNTVTVTRVATGSAQIIVNTEDGNFVAVHTVTVT
ncbi:DUF2280 domain-containing protein [Enterobacter hormaechei]|uniref:DUF2280 domain-containing protein n=1 Tax=Enterobacter hormaechei TaxID=158836 RepID=UPI00388EE7C3